MEPCNFTGNSIQATPRGDVKHGSFFPNTERAVGGQRRRRDVCQLFSLGRKHKDAKAAFCAEGRVDVPFLIDRHAVNARLFSAEVGQNRFLTERPIFMNGKRVQGHSHFRIFGVSLFPGRKLHCRFPQHKAFYHPEKPLSRSAC